MWSYFATIGGRLVLIDITLSKKKQEEITMSEVDLFDEGEKIKAYAVSEVRQQSTNAYWKTILENDKPAFGSFLIDYKRSGKFKTHWNPEASQSDICDFSNGKSSCKMCERISKLTADEKKEKNKPSTSVERLLILYNFSDENVNVAANDGTIYTKHPVQVYIQKAGQNEQNFERLLKANGDPDKYYELDPETQKPLPDKKPKDLDKNELMYQEDGTDKVWAFEKVTSSKGPTTYTVDCSESKRNIRANKDYKLTESSLTVPKEVREYFNNLTWAEFKKEIVPHYLAHKGNVDWEAWGCVPPGEGARKFDPPKMEKKEKEAVAAGKPNRKTPEL